MLNFTNPRAIRIDSSRTVSKFRGGKLAPVSATIFMENEGGPVQNTIALDLDPIAGEMLTEINAHVVSLFVPFQAIDVLKNPDEDHAGNAEIYRDKLTSGEVIFGLEAENDISKAIKVNPIQIDGVKKVNEVLRFAYIAANNYLRQRKYIKAQLLDSTATTIQPALVSQTILQRFNAVLDPDDRINGAVELQIPSMILPLKTESKIPHNGITVSRDPAGELRLGQSNLGDRLFTEFDGGEAGNVSLTDFYHAEAVDRRTREMDQIKHDNPEYGEEIVLRAVHGLRVESGKHPFVLYEREGPMRSGMARGMDGASLDTFQTDISGAITFTNLVPRTEFGGVVITMIAVKPDETILAQPHPFLSDVITGSNYAAAELAVDPVPVHVRQLDADCDPSDEGQVAFYVGPNHMKRRYQSYGFARNLDQTTVANKTALWQIEIPLSVDPTSILYPNDISHYPFSDQTANVVRCTATMNATIATPLFFGPTPVENLDFENEDLIFGEDQDAVE